MATWRRALVTGGAGFIGSHIADALLNRGCEVAVVDNLSTGSEGHVPSGAQFYPVDICDADLATAFGEFKPDVVFHLAGQLDVRRSVDDPLFDAQVNVMGSLRLLELCRKHGAKRVIFASTGGAVYGEQEEFPATEEHPLRPASPYGVAKLSVERYLHYYSLQYGFRTTALRFANVYGPRQNSQGEAGVVAIFIDQLLQGKAPKIFGDGGQTRDFVCVSDVARAAEVVLDRDLVGEYNVGTGVETSVNELYAALQAVVGTKIEAVYEDAKAGEQRRSCLTAGKLSDAAGWKPSTTLAAGLRLTLSYFEEQIES